MKIGQLLLSFCLFAMIGVFLGFQMSRMSILENELRKYLIFVDIQQSLEANDTEAAKQKLANTLADEYETIEALATANPEFYRYHKELMEN